MPKNNPLDNGLPGLSSALAKNSPSLRELAAAALTYQSWLAKMTTTNLNEDKFIFLFDLDDTLRFNAPFFEKILRKILELQGKSPPPESQENPDNVHLIDRESACYYIPKGLFEQIKALGDQGHYVSIVSHNCSGVKEAVRTLRQDCRDIGISEICIVERDIFTFFDSEQQDNQCTEESLEQLLEQPNNKKDHWEIWSETYGKSLHTIMALLTHLEKAVRIPSTEKAYRWKKEFAYKLINLINQKNHHNEQAITIHTITEENLTETGFSTDEVTIIKKLQSHLPRSILFDDNVTNVGLFRDIFASKAKLVSETSFNTLELLQDVCKELGINLTKQAPDESLATQSPPPRGAPQLGCNETL